MARQNENSMRADCHPAGPLPGRHRDPIVAVATAPGRGAVGILRASGLSLIHI